MNNFNFGPYNESQLQDGPFLDSSYVDTENESQNRKEFSYPLCEIRNFINLQLIPAIVNCQEKLYAGANINIYRRDGKLYISATGGGGGGGVSQQYVDEMDAAMLQAAKQYVNSNSQGFLKATDILDRLNSTAANKALSANQGKILNDKVNKIGSVEEVTLTNTGWTAAYGMWYKDYTVQGITALDHVEVNPKVVESWTVAQEQAYFLEYRKLDFRSTTKSNAIRFYVHTQLTGNLTFYLKTNGFVSDAHEHYEGAYTVTPTPTQQTLGTNDLIMDNDVTVNPISYQETPNAQGGNTVDIAGGGTAGDDDGE